MLAWQVFFCFEPCLLPLDVLKGEWGNRRGSEYQHLELGWWKIIKTRKWVLIHVQPTCLIAFWLGYLFNFHWTQGLSSQVDWNKHKFLAALSFPKKTALRQHSFDWMFVILPYNYLYRCNYVIWGIKPRCGVAHLYPSPWEAKAGGFQVWGQPGLHKDEAG
jgi:hypothetical protein